MLNWRVISPGLQALLISLAIALAYDLGEAPEVSHMPSDRVQTVDMKLSTAVRFHGHYGGVTEAAELEAFSTVIGLGTRSVAHLPTVKELLASSTQALKWRRSSLGHMPPGSRSAQRSTTSIHDL